MKLTVEIWHESADKRFAEHYQITYNTGSLFSKAEIRATWMLPNDYVPVQFILDDDATVEDAEAKLRATLHQWLKDNGQIRDSW